MKGKTKGRGGGALCRTGKEKKKSRFNFFFEAEEERDCVEMHFLLPAFENPFRAWNCSPNCVQGHERLRSCASVGGEGRERALACCRVPSNALVFSQRDLGRERESRFSSNLSFSVVPLQLLAQLCCSLVSPERSSKRLRWSLKN